MSIWLKYSIRVLYGVFKLVTGHASFLSFFDWCSNFTVGKEVVLSGFKSRNITPYTKTIVEAIKVPTTKNNTEVHTCLHISQSGWLFSIMHCVCVRGVHTLKNSCRPQYDWGWFFACNIHQFQFEYTSLEREPLLCESAYLTIAKCAIPY